VTIQKMIASTSTGTVSLLRVCSARNWGVRMRVSITAAMLSTIGIIQNNPGPRTARNFPARNTTACSHCRTILSEARTIAASAIRSAPGTKKASERNSERADHDKNDSNRERDRIEGHDSASLYRTARPEYLARQTASPYSPALMQGVARNRPFPHRHLLGIEGLSPEDINYVLDLADGYVELNRQAEKKRTLLRGRTIINCFFENSTRTRTSFEVAGKRLGGDVINMSVAASSMHKGETLIDTAMTLNAMHPDVLIVRHPESGAVQLLSEKLDCAVINAGDGSHEHPTQALLDALTIRRRKGRLGGLTVAICGDVLHSRVARSNIALLNTMGAHVRVVAPLTLLPAEIERLGVEVFHDMAAGLADVDIVMMLRLQSERMHGAFIPTTREYFYFFGLDYDKLRVAKPDALIMHPGPMNRGVEIGSEVADDIDRSLIRQQVEMGVAVRMACLEILMRDLGNGPPLP